MSGKNNEPNIPSKEKNSYHYYTNQTKKSTWISAVQSPKRTIDFTFCFEWTGLVNGVNGRQPASVKQQKARQQSGIWKIILIQMAFRKQLERTRPPLLLAEHSENFAKITK